MLPVSGLWLDAQIASHSFALEVIIYLIIDVFGWEHGSQEKSGSFRPSKRFSR